MSFGNFAPAPTMMPVGLPAFRGKARAPAAAAEADAGTDTDARAKPGPARDPRARKAA